jgi:hypothetical protein
MDINEECELCGMVCKLQKHHLIPQRVSRSAKYSKSLKTDESNFLWICNECHGQIHALYSEHELRDLYFTKELLCEAEDLKRFIMWKIKHPKFKGSSKMSNKRK